MRFQLIADKLGMQVKQEEKGEKVEVKEQQKTWLDTMKSKYTLIKVVIGCWLVTYGSLYVHVVSQALKEFGWISVALKDLVVLS